MDKRRLNIIFYIVFFGVVSFFFFSLVASLVVLLPPVQTRALNFVGGELSSIITGNITIGRVKSNILTYVNLEDVTIRHDEYSDVYLHSSEIKIRYNIPALLKKQIHISSIRVGKLDANLYATKEGKYLIPFLLKNVKRKKGIKIFDDLELKIGPLRIRDLNASFSDNKYKYYSAAKHARIRAYFPRIDSVSVSLVVPDGFFHSDWWNGHVDTLNTDVSIQPEGINIKQVYASGSGSVARGYGWIPFSYSREWNLHATVSSRIKPVYAIEKYAPAFDTTGEAHGVASFTGTFRKPLYSVDIEGKDVSYMGIALDTFRFIGNTDDREFINSSISGSTKLGDLKLDGKICIKHLNSFHPTVDKYTYRLKFDKLRFPAIAGKFRQFEKFPAENGTLTFNMSGTGYRELPQTVFLDFRALQGGLSDTLKMTGKMNSLKWDLSAVYGNNRINANGILGKKGSVSGTATGTFFNVYPFVNYFVHEPVYGNLVFNTSVLGTVKAPVFSGTIQSSSLKWRGSMVDSLYISADFDKQILLKKGFCRADLILDSIASYFAKKDIRGRVRMSVNASGRIDKPELDIRMKAENLWYKMLLAQECSGNIRINDFNDIILNDVNIVKGRTRLAANGTIDCSGFINRTDNIGASMSMNASLKKGNSYADAGSFRIRGNYLNDSIRAAFSSADFEISALDEWIDKIKNISGRVSAKSEIAGTPKNPQCELSVNVEKPRFDKYSISSFSSHCNLKDSLLSFDSTRLLLDTASEMYLSGMLPLSLKNLLKTAKNDRRQGRVYIQSRNFDIGYLSRLFKSDWNYTGKSIVSLMLTKGQYGWSVDGMTNIDSAKVNNSKINARASGISVKTAINGRLAEPVIKYSVKTERIAYSKVRIDSSKFEGVLCKDSLEIKSGMVSMFKGGLIYLNGMVPLLTSGRLNAKDGLRISFNTKDILCTEFNIFTGNELIRDGKVSASGTVGFRDGQPIVNGSISLRKGAFAIDGVSPKIGPIDADFIMKDDTLKIAGIKGTWGKGSIDAIGFVVWNTTEGVNDIAVNGHINNLSVDLTDIANSRIQKSQFSISKRKTGYLLSGNVDLGATRIVRDIGLNNLIEQISYGDQLELEENPFLKDLHLNIKVNLIENPVIDMNLGYFELGGDMNIAGTASKPTFIGDLTLSDNSYVLYLDKQFDIRSGHLSNYNQNAFNPLIDLNAKTGVSYVGSDSSLVLDSIKLRISGQMDKIVFHLSAENTSMSEADIISILTFGQKLSSVGSDRKDLTDRIKTFAGQSLLGLGTRKLEQLFDIDKINVSGNIFDMSKEKSPTLTVTKRISPKLMVTYTTAIANLSQRKISAFYSLTKYFYLRGETENKGESGVDFIFKISK